MIAIMGAVHDEIAGLQRRMTVEETIVQPGWRVFKGAYRQCPDVLLAQTGIGGDAARRTAQFVLDNYPVTTLVSIGFAGALSPALRIGDLVLCLQFCLADNSSCDAERELLPFVAQALAHADLNLFAGRSVTVERIVTTPEQKRALSETTRAQMVDMEGFWIAQLASARHLPFVAVRAISDTAAHSLPAFDQFFDDHGRLHPKQALRHFAARPRELMQIPKIFRNARTARQRLTTFCDALLPALLESEYTSCAHS